MRGTVITSPPTPPPTVTYGVSIGSFTNGGIEADKAAAAENDVVMLTVYPSPGYELESISAFGADIRGNGSPYCTFYMPAFAVTVTATFRKTADQLSVEAAIESGTYQVVQATANDAESVRTWLTNELNALFGQTHDMQLRSATSIDGEVTITAITPATARTASEPSGVNGLFSFTAPLSQGSSTALAVHTGGVIIATPYSSTTGIERVELSLKVYFQGNTLYVSSPVAETVEVYSFSGAKLFSAKKGAGDTSFTVPTNLKAVIVRGSSGWTLKTINN